MSVCLIKKNGTSHLPLIWIKNLNLNLKLPFFLLRSSCSSRSRSDEQVLQAYRVAREHGRRVGEREQWRGEPTGQWVRRESRQYLQDKEQAPTSQEGHCQQLEDHWRRGLGGQDKHHVCVGGHCHLQGGRLQL